MKSPLALLAGLPFLAALPWPSARAEIPASPDVIITDAKAIEGDGGTTRFSAQVFLNWSLPIEVELNAVPGTAGTTDYSFPPTRLKLLPGPTPITVLGEIVGDLIPEENESFDLVATAVPGTFPNHVNSQGGRISIIDDDKARVPGLHVDGLTVMEGARGAFTPNVRIRLEPARESPVSVDFKTVDGDATAGGGDYLPTSGTLTFAPGEVSKNIALQINGDTLWERDESFTVELANPVGATLAVARAEIVIVNDDPGSIATLDEVHVSEGNQGARPVTLTIRFDRPAPGPSKVQVTPRPGSARADQDFRADAQVLYVSAGDLSAPFTIDVIGDTVPECDEGLLIEYQAFYTGDESRKIAGVLIVNDDGPSANPACPDPFKPSLDPVPEPPRPADGGMMSDAGDSDASSPTIVDAAGVTSLPAPNLSQKNGSCAMASGGKLGAGGLLVLLALMLGARTRQPRSPRRADADSPP